MLIYNEYITKARYLITDPLAKYVECLPMARETGLQSQDELDERLKY